MTNALITSDAHLGVLHSMPRVCGCLVSSIADVLLNLHCTICAHQACIRGWRQIPAYMTPVGGQCEAGLAGHLMLHLGGFEPQVKPHSHGQFRCPRRQVCVPSRPIATRRRTGTRRGPFASCNWPGNQRHLKLLVVAMSKPNTRKGPFRPVSGIALRRKPRDFPPPPLV